MPKNTQRNDLILLIVWPLIVFVIIFFCGVRINYLESLILFFAIPSVYLSFRSKEKIKKVGIFSILVSIPVALIFELLGVGNRAWSIPRSVFPWRVFGFSPIENYIWQFLTVYLILIFYESFCTKDFQPKISGKIKIMNCVLYGVAAILVIMYVWNKSLLDIPYSYIWPGIILFIAPISLFLIKYPRFLTSFLKAQLYFFYVHMMFELVGIQLGHWIYAGSSYLGWVRILGQSFPLEELIFVMMLGAFAACTYYEFFTNDFL